MNSIAIVVLYGTVQKWIVDIEIAEEKDIAIKI